MAFVEIRFPTDIAYGSAGGPVYSTDIVITRSGHEQRNSNWAEARARYDVAHGVKNQTQLNTLIAFFRARKGRADGFRFKDWTDFAATAQIIGTGDGATSQFQLIKTYENGSVIETRTISKPVDGTVNIYLDGVSENSANYSVNTLNGIITFNTEPADGVEISADFEFDVPVRFDTDRLSASIDAYGSNSWNNIPLVEIRT